MTMTFPVEFATVLPGSTAFKEGNVNDTFRGQVLRSGGIVSNAIIKDIPPRELANELIAFVLAKALSLPIPNAFLSLASPGDILSTKGPLTIDGRRLLLASENVGAPNIAFRYTSDIPGRARLLGAVTAWPQLGRLYGFDAWVANTDRHQGNLLFGSGGDAWLIDHGWAFTGPTWTAGDLIAATEYRHRLTEWLTPHLTQTGKETRAQQAGALEADLRNIDVDAAIEASHAPLLVSPGDLRSLRTFLKDRIAEVARLASKALDIPVMM